MNSDRTTSALANIGQFSIERDSVNRYLVPAKHVLRNVLSVRRWNVTRAQRPGGATTLKSNYKRTTESKSPDCKLSFVPANEIEKISVVSSCRADEITKTNRERARIINSCLKAISTSHDYVHLGNRV